MVQVLCEYCRTSKVMHKAGPRRTSKGIVQRYRCKDCGRYFSSSLHPYSLYPDEMIFRALELYNRGMELETISKNLEEEYSIRTPTRTIYSWVERYEKRFRLYVLRGKRDDKLAGPIEEIPSTEPEMPSFKYHREKVNAFIDGHKYSKYVNRVLTTLEEDPLNDLSPLGQLKKTSRELKLREDPKGIKLTLDIIQRACSEPDQDRIKELALLIDRDCIAADLPLVSSNERKKHEISWRGSADLVSVTDQGVELVLFSGREDPPSDILRLHNSIKNRFGYLSGLNTDRISISILDNGKVYRVQSK